MSENQMVASTARRASTDFTPDREPWLDDAVCQQTDPEIFFPEKGESASAAKRVCAGCDVREQCLQFVMARESRFSTNVGRHGVWGGLTPTERARLAAGGARDDVVPEERLRKLHADGLMDTEIAARLGLSPSQVGRRRNRLGLKANAAGGYRRSA